MLASLALIRDRGRIGVLVDDETATAHGVPRLRPARSAATLGELAAMVAAGTLQLPIRRRYPLDAAADAHRDVETGHGYGKVVLTMDRSR